MHICWVSGAVGHYVGNDVEVYEVLVGVSPHELLLGPLVGPSEALVPLRAASGLQLCKRAHLRVEKGVAQEQLFVLDVPILVAEV